MTSLSKEKTKLCRRIFLRFFCSLEVIDNLASVLLRKLLPLLVKRKHGWLCRTCLAKDTPTRRRMNDVVENGALCMQLGVQQGRCSDAEALVPRRRCPRCVPFPKPWTWGATIPICLKQRILLQKRVWWFRVKLWISKIKFNTESQCRLPFHFLGVGKYCQRFNENL